MATDIPSTGFLGFRKFWNSFPSARVHGGKAAQPDATQACKNRIWRTTVWRAEDIRAFIERIGKEGEDHE